MFFAGIVGVLQACSLKQEGVGLVFLLFLLQFCSGPLEPEETVTVVYADNFDINQGPIGGLCDDLSTTNGDLSDILTNANLPFGERELLHLDLNTGTTAQITMEVVGGQLSLRVTGVDNCLLQVFTPSFGNIASTPNRDHTAVSKLVIEVATGGSGGVFLCNVGELSSGGGIRAWQTNIDASVPGIITIENPTTPINFDPSDVEFVVLQCDLSNNAVLLIDRIELQG